MHPLVRDLYKRALSVGRDYPLGMEYVRRTWKKALRNPDNCHSCYANLEGNNLGPGGTNPRGLTVTLEAAGCEKELHKAVARGRFMVREMIGVIQLKKYRTMKRRYDTKDNESSSVTSEYRKLLNPSLHYDSSK